MSTNPENPTDENQSNLQSGITRRSFIKRTSATVVVTTLALYSFRHEARAQVGVSFVLLSTTRTYDASDSGYFSEFAAQAAADAAIRGATGGFTDDDHYGSAAGMVALNPPVQTPSPFTPMVTTYQVLNSNLQYSWAYSITGQATITYYGVMA